MKKTGIIVSVVAVIILIAYFFIDGGGKPVIRLHDGQWKSLSVNNAIVEYVIEKGYGYPVEQVVQTVPMMQKMLPKGEIDLEMEGWHNSKLVWYNENIENGNIVNLGMIFEDGPQFLLIPKWVAEEYNIKTIFDMKDHWNLFKGIFYNGVVGWAAPPQVAVKMEAYGLNKLYNITTLQSSESLEAVLEQAQENRKPIFCYYWAPTALMGAYDWHILEEPPYSKEVWKKIEAAALEEGLRPIDEACAYESVPIDKLAHSGLFKKAPDVVKMLRQMNVGLEPLNKILAWAKENNVEDWEEAAVYYLQNYEHIWKTWVTPEAYDNIKSALQQGK